MELFLKNFDKLEDISDDAFYTEFIEFLLKVGKIIPRIVLRKAGRNIIFKLLRSF